MFYIADGTTKEHEVQLLENGDFDLINGSYAQTALSYETTHRHGLRNSTKLIQRNKSSTHVFRHSLKQSFECQI